MQKPVDDTVGAFVPGPRVELAGSPAGPLAGLGFAVKDLYDVAGQVTGYGNPDWARTGSDTAHFDGLSDHQLRDLGVRRFNDRAETWYR